MRVASEACVRTRALSPFWLVAGSLAVQLLTAGCGGGGGGGLFGLFGGGGDSGAADLFAALTGGTSESLGSSDGGVTSLASDVAAVHSPEPASLALFGGGLAVLAGWRRRSQKKSSSRH